MNEKAKIREAEYFLSRMLEEESNREYFQYNLSAFLSAARSVLQYACKEAKTKSGGQKWYDKRVSESKTIEFFRCKRNVNIHAELIKPQQRIGIEVGESLHLSESVGFVLRDAKTGEVLQSSKSDPEPPRSKPQERKSTTSISRDFRFSDWPGDEDVPTLSQKYLNEVKELVDDGIKGGILSGQVGAVSGREEDSWNA